MLFTFYTYCFNIYSTAYILYLAFFNIYCLSFFIVIFFFRWSNIQNLLEVWLLHLNVYFHNYTLSTIRGNVATIRFYIQIPLTILSVFALIFDILECQWLFFKNLRISSNNDLHSTNFFKLPALAYIYKSNILINFFFKNFILIYSFLKKIIIALLLSFIYIVYTVYFFQIQFLKQLAIWFVIGIIFYWLISGFNFFVKHYQFGKFTGQIQRFWKRANTYFWLIEGFLITLFFYYFLNSSQEPLYMYDYSAINQDYLASLTVIYTNTVMLSFTIYLMYILLLQLNFTKWAQQSLFLLIISIFVFFTFFIETYQFYYLLNTFSEKVWLFNEETNLWVLTQDAPVMRCKHYYLMTYLIAKYWHFLFIFLSWVFFMAKNLEKRQVNYVLFGANLQNLVLLFILNISCYAQWLKWFYRRFYDIPYKWFFINSSNSFFANLWHEFVHIYLNLLNININFYTYSNFIFKAISIWNVDSIFFWQYL